MVYYFLYFFSHLILHCRKHDKFSAYSFKSPIFIKILSINSTKTRKHDQNNEI